MGLKIIVFILGVAIPWSFVLCNPVNPLHQIQETLSLSSEDDSIQFTTEDLTALEEIPEKNPIFPIAESTEGGKSATSSELNSSDSDAQLIPNSKPKSKPKPISAPIIKIQQEKSGLNSKKREISHNPKEISKQYTVQNISVSETETENVDAPAALTEADLTEDLEDWIAPLYIRQIFPYTISGYDENSRPIYMVEMGRMDLRSVVERGVDAQEALLKYTRQITYRILKHLRELETEDGKPVTELMSIIDFEGLQLRQFTPKTIAYVIKLAYSFRDFIEQYMGEGYLVNVNFLAEQLIQLVRPVFGKTLERLTLLGTNPQKWRPVLRRTFGPQNLPEYYGGDSNWKPVKYYGA